MGGKRCRVQRGFALLTVLVCLIILTTLSLSGLKTVRNAIKTNEHFWQKDFYTMKAREIMRKLERDYLTQPMCIRPIMNPAELAKQPRTWWDQFSCSGNFDGIRYDYTLEFLGKDPCSILVDEYGDSSNKQTITSEYYRITLSMYPAKLAGAHILLQSTIASKSQESATCNDTHHKVMLGSHLWRELIGRKYM